MREFLVRAPDDRLLPRRAETLKALQDDLVAGYAVEFELLDGVRVKPLPDILPHHSLMTHLLREYGDELREWVAEAIADGVAKGLAQQPSTFRVGKLK